MRKIDSVNWKPDVVFSFPFLPIVPINKICRRKKNKKNPVTLSQRRLGCKEEIMYEENGLFSDFVGIH